MTGGALSAAEIDRLLREPIVARLATIGPDGYPHVVPVWTEWDGRHVWLVVRARARYVEHLRQDPRVALSVVRGDEAGTRVLVQGTAEIVAGPGPLAGRMLSVARRMAHRYEGEPGLAYVEESRSWPRCLVRIRPERITSWGGPDWHPRYRD